jgi:hypothetical protein
LKTWPKFYQDIVDGKKKFELRKFDRPFQLGATVILREYDNVKGYTGRRACVEITYILHGDYENFGIKNGYGIFGFKLINPTINYDHTFI